jgi:hypothetical protein
MRKSWMMMLKCLRNSHKMDFLKLEARKNKKMFSFLVEKIALFCKSLLFFFIPTFEIYN